MHSHEISNKESYVCPSHCIQVGFIKWALTNQEVLSLGKLLCYILNRPTYYSRIKDTMMIVNQSGSQC